MSADPRQVPTLPVLVELELVTGRAAKVTLFLSIHSATREGPETLDEFLNSQRRLLPVAEPDGTKRELVARDAILLVRVMSDISPHAQGHDAPAVDLVKIELANGKTVDGAVQHTQCARLSDFFNASPDFFALADTAGVVYVNKRHVVSITM
jgi:hypothetical protein